MKIARIDLHKKVLMVIGFTGTSSSRSAAASA
jgi:hypothetical protein